MVNLMDAKFKIHKAKTLNAMLFILEKLGGTTDFHKLFKVLYFADQKHLLSFGRPISGDLYIGMEYGPVPSVVYDILKSVKKDNTWPLFSENYTEWFEVTGYMVRGKAAPNLDELSESDIIFLGQSVEENSNLDFKQLVDKSHDYAWKNAQNEQMNEMNVLDIAKSGGAEDAFLAYISLNLENQQALQHG